MGRRKSTLTIRIGTGNNYRLSYEDDTPSGAEEATVEVKIIRTTGRDRDRRRTRSRSRSSSGRTPPRRYPARSSRATNPNYGCAGCGRQAPSQRVTKPSRHQNPPTENLPKPPEESQTRQPDLLPQIPPSPPIQSTQDDESDVESDINARSTTPTPPARKKNKNKKK